MAQINKDNRNQYALITGATSGIGYELAKLFAKDSYNLILVARNEERLQTVTDELKQQYGIEVTPLAKDLFRREAAQEIFDATQQMGITVNVLVNELKETNITVTALLPGATDTDFFHKANQQDTVGYREGKLAAPEEVAKDGYEALMKGESKIISGAKTKMHVFMSDLLGDKAAAANSRKQMEPSDKAGGEKLPGHQSSREERQAIGESTGDNT